MPKGLLNPKNATESTGGGFREGVVRIDKSAFAVVQPRGGKDREAPQPVCALVWDVTRLDEHTLEPLVSDAGDNEGAPVTETIVFGMGGKSLTSVHPGKADSADDDDVEDLGVEVGVEGPTVFVENTQFSLNKKSALANLMVSLEGAGFKPEYLDRVWANDFTNSVFFMKTQVSADTMKGDDGKERPINYKVVSKIIRAGYDKKGASGNGGAAKGGAKPTSGAQAPAAASGQTAATSNGKGGDEAESILKPILESLSEQLDGTRITRKALNMKVTGALADGKIAPKLHVPVLQLVKNDEWLLKNAARFDITFDQGANTIAFGTVE